MTWAAAAATPAAARKHSHHSSDDEDPVADLTKSGQPNIQAKAAVIVDLDDGSELYVKNPDDVRSIASVGKLLLALTVRDKGLALDGTTTITDQDRKIASGGARSRLQVGKTFTNHDLLRAMLISSDNRACSALGRGAGLDPDELVAAINAKATQLGLTHTHFVDPTGLKANVSTPRELVVVLKAALADPVVAEILTTPERTVTSVDKKPISIDYTSTDLALRSKRYEILGGKTGFNDGAGYCLAIAAKVAGRRVAMVFLGEEGKYTRFGDFHRGTTWMGTMAATAAAPK